LADEACAGALYDIAAFRGKTVQKPPEFLPADSGTAVVSVFSIHLNKLTHLNKCLTSQDPLFIDDIKT
jgi:hypothetical protein